MLICHLLLIFIPININLKLSTFIRMMSMSMGIHLSLVDVFRNKSNLKIISWLKQALNSKYISVWRVKRYVIKATSSEEVLVNPLMYSWSIWCWFFTFYKFQVLWALFRIIFRFKYNWKLLLWTTHINILLFFLFLNPFALRDYMIHLQELLLVLLL